MQDWRRRAHVADMAGGLAEFERDIAEGTLAADDGRNLAQVGDRLDRRQTQRGDLRADADEDDGGLSRRGESGASACRRRGAELVALKCFNS